MAEVPQVGQRIRISFNTPSGKTKHEGIVLPPASVGYTTLKLLNGYNISHPEVDISDWELLNPITQVTSKTTNNTATEVEVDLPLVRIIHTGGTIASKVDYATGAVVARFEPEELLSSIPELGQIAQVETVKLGNMWSDDIRPQHWNLILQATAKAFAEGVEGVVITSGTDTMHLSACALGFGWSGNGGTPPGRIVFTGSQRSSDRGSSDSTENILAAVHWAAHGPKPNGGLADSSVIIMHSETDDGNCAVLPGCATRKNHTSRRDAFQAINQPPLANIMINLPKVTHTLTQEYKKLLSKCESRVRNNEPILFDQDVRIAQFVAGPHLHHDIVEQAIGLEYDALIFHATGLGHLPLEDPLDNAPENSKLAKVLKLYCGDGGVVVLAAQCISGPLNLDVYSKGRLQRKLGILGHSTSMSPEAVAVKLHWLLSQDGVTEELWCANLIGENPQNIRK